MTQIKYTCGECGVVNRVIEVADRPTGVATGFSWFRETVMVAVSADHASESPGCPNKSMQRVATVTEG